MVVRDEPTIRLPRSGRWETGLGCIAPALDDALGATAFAVAWRWACAEKEANAWPGLSLIASKAVDEPVTVTETDALATWSGRSVARVVPAPVDAGGRSWSLRLPERAAVLSISDGRAADWSEVNRIADIVAAWFDVPWTAT